MILNLSPFENKKVLVMSNKYVDLYNVCSEYYVEALRVVIGGKPSERFYQISEAIRERKPTNVFVGRFRTKLTARLEKAFPEVQFHYSEAR